VDVSDSPAVKYARPSAAYVHASSETNFVVFSKIVRRQSVPASDDEYTYPVETFW
jgi:hypothetical protein